MKLLVKLGTLEAVIELACEQQAFDFAKDLAKNGLATKMGFVHLKHAMALEDEGQFDAAEAGIHKSSK